MRLSNTMMINASLLPSSKKAFTLAEVLITLSILGVVAALTIPSLVNRQSEMAAQVKLKKAIANYENVAAVYMVENESTNISGIAANSCANIGNYFKVVNKNSSNACVFTTADGVLWNFNSAGNVVIYDSENAPRYGVVAWTEGGVVNGTDANGFDGPQTPTDLTFPKQKTNTTTTGTGESATTTNGLTAPVHDYYSAPDFMNVTTNQASTSKTGITDPANVKYGMTVGTNGSYSGGTDVKRSTT